MYHAAVREGKNGMCAGRYRQQGYVVTRVEFHNADDLLKLFEKISAKTKEVREEIYRLLVDEFAFFN